MKIRALSALLVSFAFCATSMAAQDWPTKPIRLVIPFAPGGSTDVLGRIVAQKLSLALGQSVVVENKPGAAGNLGANEVVRSAQDGYTIVMGGGSNAVNANLYHNLPFDFARDLTGLAMIGVSPNLMVVSTKLPVKTAGEFVQYAKSHKGSVNYASSGIGATTHLAAELFKSVTGTEMTHIPFNGSSPALTALMSGQVDVMFDSIISSAPIVKGGRLRALAVTGPTRSPILPDVPTLKEAGINVEAISYFALYAPAHIPAAVRTRYNTELRKIMKMPEVAAKLAEFGVQPLDLGSDELNAFTRQQIQNWAVPVRLSGAHVD